MIYPKHIGFITDGNRTWAKERGLPKYEGHRAGFKNLVNLSKYLFTETPIKSFTIRALSTENLKNREKTELSYLFKLYKLLKNDMGDFLSENKINFCWKGKKDGLPDDLVEFLLNAENKHSYGTDRFLNLAINYGGRDEIIRGIKKMYSQDFDINNLTEENFGQFLDFDGQEVVDMVIRTKGDISPRLSGFLLWRVGYAQLFFSSKKCPEFSLEDLKQSLLWFDSMATKRNWGK